MIDERETQSETHSKRIFQTGACYNDKKFSHCALSNKQCPSGTIFRADRDMRDFDDDPCDPNDMKIGRCLKEDTCALRPTDCAIDTSVFNFNPQDNSCTIQRDRKFDWNFDEPEFTQFGSCYNGQTGAYLCIYDPSDCDESGEEVYLSPDDTRMVLPDATCDCSEVHVTGCIRSMRSSCAIEPDSCPDFSEIISPHDQRQNRLARMDGLDCRLCRYSNTARPTFPPTTKKLPTGGATDAPSVGLLKVGADGSNAPSTRLVKVVTDGNRERANKGPVVGFAVGGGIILLIIIAFFYIMINRRRNKEFDTTNVKPPSHITIS